MKTSKTQLKNSVTSMKEPVIVVHPWPGYEIGPLEAKDLIDRFDKRLRNHVVPVPKEWSKAACPTRRFPRACFSSAIFFIRCSPHLPNALYVFGETIGGGFSQHGWVELDNRVVFDGVMQQFYDKDEFYSAEHAIPWYRYTRHAVMYLYRKMTKDPSMTYRWDHALRLPWARDPQNPLLVDLDRAKQSFPSKRKEEVSCES